MSETKTQVGQIRTEVHGHVFKIIIDNVAKKNSFSPQMMAQMSDAMTLLDRTDDYWVGVLCAEGPDFTAGLDMPKFFGPKAREHRDQARQHRCVRAEEPVPQADCDGSAGHLLHDRHRNDAGWRHCRGGRRRPVLSDGIQARDRAAWWRPLSAI